MSYVSILFGKGVAGHRRAIPWSLLGKRSEVMAKRHWDSRFGGRKKWEIVWPPLCHGSSCLKIWLWIYIHLCTQQMIWNLKERTQRIFTQSSLSTRHPMAGLSRAMPPGVQAGRNAWRVRSKFVKCKKKSGRPGMFGSSYNLSFLVFKGRLGEIQSDLFIFKIALRVPYLIWLGKECSHFF